MSTCFFYKQGIVCISIKPAGLLRWALCIMEREIKEYLAWKGTYATRASVSYKIWLDRFVKVNGERLLEAYDIESIVKFRHWLEERFSSSTVQFAIIVVKNFFQFYKQQDRHCISPSFIKLPHVIRKSHRAIKESEYQKVISGIAKNDFLGLRDSLIIRLLWDTGIRVSELCDLNVSQIDEVKATAVIQSKKSYIYRVIVWSKETHELLLKYLTFRLELKNHNNADSLFIGFQKGRGWSLRLTKRSVERITKKYVTQAGIKERISPHSFRHGWAHKRRDRNAPLAFIQKGLGHTSPVSTFIYEQYNDKEFETNASFYLKPIRLTAKMSRI